MHSGLPTGNCPMGEALIGIDLAYFIKFPQKADEALIGILTRMRLAHSNPISKLYEHGNDSCECTQICLSSGCQASFLGLPRGLAFGLSASLDVCHKVDRHAKLQAFASSHDWHPLDHRHREQTPKANPRTAS